MATITITIADRMNTVPGFRTSTTFFTFLRANLILPSSTLNSNTSTPLLSACSSQTLPPLQSLPSSSLATMTSVSASRSSLETASPQRSDPLVDIPPLVTTTLTTSEDKIAALKLIADSVAQQRQQASRAVIFHPLTIAVYILILALTSQTLYKSRSDVGLLATTCAGITMAGLVAIRGVAGGYLNFAENVTWKFLQNDDADGEEDIVIGSRYGSELIGAAVLRLERSPSSPGSSSSKKKGGKNSKNRGNGIIRAWTVRIRYRGNGVGTELLEEAVRVTRESFGGNPEIGFAKEHVNSQMVLPEMFNRGFRKREVKAARMLEGVIEGK
ncbi:uncharacterized protein BP5553_04170 [Venustampulla echinocandica]|uniref:N-acetyltransferase domain-containing protein n=1 Tax=Venustampulla echinocandica TaxID=2656787 RepID=A0A370TWD1_9HELO|nr:uncharacterized protein BP5553_04170 [Venustampulla echinocandica]RDL39830.1 hypothetical protein BP5553_04170 [Venustampulla echinocandica]